MPASESKTSASHVESVKSAQLPSASQDSKELDQGSNVNSHWRQIQCDVAQMRQAINEEERALNNRKQELLQKETVLVNMLQNSACEEQQARTRVEEELSQERERMQNDLAQIRHALDDEVRLRDARERELREKNTILGELQNTLGEEQQVRTTLEEQLHTEMLSSQARQQELQTKETAYREQQRLLEERLREKERIVDQLQNTLGKEQQLRTRLEESLQTEMLSSRARQQELQKKENANREQQRRLEEERQQKETLEGRLREKERIVDQIQNTLGKEQQVRTRLEERLQTEMLSSRARQQELQTKEKAYREQQRLLKEEREQKAFLEERLREKERIVDQLQNTLGEERQVRTRLEERLQTERLSSRARQQELRHLLEEKRQEKSGLEERLRNLELQMQEERSRYLSNERQLQSAVSAAQEELTEYQRRQPHDWIIQREEVLLSESVLGKGAWGSVRQGTFRGCQVAVKEIHELILSPHNRRLFEREMSIASCCRHPNLLQFIGATNDDGSPLFVTEILETSLRRMLSERALNHEEIVSLTLDVAKGLNYLHLNRPLPIIHRDISSANVLLWRRDDCWRAKLSDYGSANFMRQCMTVSPGAIIYSAPEALTSQQSPKVKK